MNVYRSLRLTTSGTLAGSTQSRSRSRSKPFRLGSQPCVNFAYPSSPARRRHRHQDFTMGGQFVRDLGGTPLWDGRNTSGKSRRSGSYVFEVKSSNGSAPGGWAVLR